MKTRSGSRRAWTRRALSLLLAAVMVLGFFPGFPGAENSGAQAHWADPYLSQLVEWGVIREDQANNPNLALTRADFMAIVNRAYGYKTPGETPFEDVEPNKWYYDDVGIAYTARYIVGTSPTTASPNNPLTRETATTILGRNMMLQESPGEILDFTDARQIANWAMGTVKSSLEHYIVNGYNDGTFRPKRNVSWGEMAAMVTKLVGTPLQEPGDYSLGGVFGNVTITSSDVTLRDSVVGGDVYITSGVGLGNVKLENVNVLGRIIASGTGRSEGGEASILLRNVTADELLIDNMQDDYVSVQVDGISEIPNTTVRTSAYIEDNTPDGMGLQHISIEGDTYPEGEEPEDWEPIQVDLAGRIGEVVNRTPGSQVRVAKGTVEKLTVDESATDSTVIIDRGAVVKELALDTSTYVTGEGDIGHLIVNAPGCVIDILPDQITIRPGITAIIAGEEMDSVAAEEFSMDPLILAGYPEAHDITPTGLEAIFMTNKAGTIYYAVSPITDGSVGEEDLIDPPSYGNIAVVNGSVKVSKGNEEVVAAIGGLTPGGSYYLSAVLVDAKGNRSPVKVISFTTPDNTIPAFCEGYPYMSKVSPKDSVVVTMTNKDCKLYYALLPEGAVAPTEMEMKTNAVAGALGYGVRDAKKNVEDVFRVNDQILKEQTTYVLYFFLCDADGVNKSPITSITFTTADETPPNFINGTPTVTKVDKTSVTLTVTLDEDATVYWVAIPSNTTNYPKPQPGTDFEIAPKNSEYGKLQIENAMNIGTDGKSGRLACKGNVPGTITVSGLKPETAYDFYYIAKDTAGNYTVIWDVLTISPLDESGPKFTQSFSDSSSLDGKSDPTSSTDIYLDVSEDIRYTGQGGGTSFLKLYQDGSAASKQELITSLQNSIKLHKIDLYDSSISDVNIDYSQVRIEPHEGGIRITFPNSAVPLENGGQYYFTIEKVTDVSSNQNPVVPSRVDFYTNESLSKSGGHDVPVFIVEFARVDFSTPGLDHMPIKRDGSVDPYTRPAGDYAEDDYVRRDMSFRMRPVSTETVANNIRYDLLLWTDSVVQFDLYYRVVDANGNRIDTEGVYPDNYPSTATTQTLSANQTASKEDYLLTHLGPKNRTEKADVNGWFYLGKSGPMNPTNGSWSGRGVNYSFNGCKSLSFPQLNNLKSDLRYEVIIHLTYMDDIPEIEDGQETWKNWNGEVKFYANVAAGQGDNLENLCGSLTQNNWENAKKLGLGRGAVSIGRNNTQQDPIDTQELSRLFTDSRLPRFDGDAPTFEAEPTTVDVKLRFTTGGTLYYVVGKADTGTAEHLPQVITTRTLLSDINGNTYPEGDATTMHPVTGGNGSYDIRLTDVSTPETGSVDLAPPKHGGDSTMQKWMLGGIKDGATIDRPEEENLIVRPTNQYIFNPKNQADTAGAISGNFPFKGRTEETLTVEGLTPETDYFAYFVIKGEADTLSHVYIYQFKTPKAEKPKITTLNNYTVPNDDQHAGASMRTNIDSKLSYLVFLRAEAESSKFYLLRQKVSIPKDYADKTNLTDKGVVSADGKSVSISALDAMLNPYHSNYGGQQEYEGYTLFDVYADKDLKTSMSDLLHQSYDPMYMDTSIRPVDAESDLDMKGGVVRNDTLTHTLPGNEYVILAVASVPNPNSNDRADYEVYKAYAPIRTGTTPGPEVVDWTAVFTPGKRSDLTYKGTIYVNFEPQLFLQPDGTTVLDNTNISSLPIILNAQGGDARVRVGTSNSQGTTLEFDGTWGKNSHVELSLTNLYTVNTARGTGKLVIDVVENKDHTGLEVKISWAPKKPETVTNVPYQDEQTDVTIYFNPVTGGINDQCKITGGVRNQTLTIPGDLVGQQISITGTVTPNDMLSYTYTWSVVGGAGVVSFDPNKFTSNKNVGGATLNVISSGTTTIRLRLTGTDKEQREVNEYCDMDVIVTGISLKGFSTSVGRIENGAIYWDLSKGLSATLTLSSTAPLGSDIGPDKVTLDPGTSITKGTATFSNDRTEISIPLNIASGVAIPSDPPRLQDLVVHVGNLKCTIPVYYEGSMTGQSLAGQNFANLQVKPG